MRHHESGDQLHLFESNPEGKEKPVNPEVLEGMTQDFPDEEAEEEVVLTESEIEEGAWIATVNGKKVKRFPPDNAWESIGHK